jgi:branched-chain amino acid transport system substrate-binding protein
MFTHVKKPAGIAVLLGVVAVLMLAVFVAAGCGKGTDETTTTQAVTTTAPAGETTTTAATGQEPVAVTEWDISMLSVLSGPVAFAGEPALWSAQYAAELINAAGGIRGVPIKITGIDTAFDPAKAASGMTNVIDKALIVLGPMDGPGAEACVPVFTEAKVPVIGAFTSPAERESAVPYGVAYMSDDGPASAWAIQEWLKANRIEMEATVAEFEAIGATQVGAIEISAGQLDMGTPAVKALSYNADGYVCLVRMEEFAKLGVELKNRGMAEGKRLYAPFAAFGSDLLNLAQGSLEGAYIWNKMDISSQDPKWLALVEAYRADHSGQDPVVPPVLGFYDAVNVLKVIFESEGITGDPAKLVEERQKIVDAFGNGATYDGLQFKWKWENGEMKSSAFLYQVEGAGYKLVATQ